MKNKNSLLSQNRRQFISTVLPACAISCLGFSNLLAVEESGKKSQEKTKKHKFQNEYCRTYEDAWIWRFGYYINIMGRLEEFLGKEKLIELLKKAIDEDNRKNAKDDPERTLKKFMEWCNTTYYNTALTIDIIEESDNVGEVKITECLWAKTFRDRNAGDIGYASVCYGDFSAARAYSPKLKMERTKTLMQGHDCCNHRWIWEQ